MTLRLSEHLELPDDLVTDTVGILAVKGAGKTYTFLVLVEEMVRVGLPVVVLDVVGVCWGVRAAANGKDPGLPVLILGGGHGDVPIAPTSGRLVAEFLASERRAAVVDLSEFDSKADQIRFVLDFMTRLYQVNREPLHVVLDEADDMAPQKPFGEETRMLRAVEVLVRRGRARGIGVTLATQRAAVLSKNVLTQVGTLIVGRTIAPQDRKAIDAWIESHGSPQQRDELMASLASLPTGTVWVWSPLRGIFQRVQIRPRLTLDSSATPKVGQVRVEPKALAPVDLEALRSRLAATIERAKSDDPTALRRRIAELERQARERPAQRPEPAQPKVERVVERVEVPVLDAAQVQVLVEATDGLRALGMRLIDVADGIVRQLSQARPLPREGAAGNVRTIPKSIPSRAVPISAPQVRAEDRKPPSGTDAAETAVSLRAGERRMLEVLARHADFKVTRVMLATLSGFTVGGGTYRTYLGVLLRHGLAVEQGGSLRVTAAGLEKLGREVPSRPQTTEEVLEQWRQALRAGERKMLDELVATYPNAVSMDDLAERTGFTRAGGTFRTYVGVLRRNGLADIDRDPILGDAIRASETLFLTGASR